MICGSDFRAAEMRLASILPRGLAAGCFIALLVAVPRLFSVVAIGYFFHAGAPPARGGAGEARGGRKTPKGAASGTPLKARLCRALAAAPEERGQAAQRRSGAPQRAGRGEGDPPRRAGDSRQPGASPEGRKGKRKRARRRPQGEPTKPRINCRAIARLPLGRLAVPSRPRAAARGRSEAGGAGRAPE